MKTVFDKKEKLKKIVTNYPYNMEDTDTVEFKVMGKTPERTIEDRSVFFEINTNIKGVEDNILHMWLNGEEAIHLGQTLVEQGVFALEANMVQHQQRFMANLLSNFIDDGRVYSLIFKNISDFPVNYGAGFVHFQITPEWHEGKAPQYMEDFTYEEVIYFSPFEQAYANQITKYTHGKCVINFIEYDHAERVQEFHKRVDELSDGCPTEECVAKE